MSKETMLNELLTEFDPQAVDANEPQIRALASDRSPAVRGLVARLGSLYVCPLMRELLLALADDGDEMVRTEAADSLSCYPDEEVFGKLLLLTSDPYYLVRAYACSSLGILGEEGIRTEDAVRRLNEVSGAGGRKTVRIHCLDALYFLGDGGALDEMAAMFPSCMYRDQCAIVSCLEEMADGSNRDRILAHLESFRGKAKGRAAETAVEKAAERIAGLRSES